MNEDHQMYRFSQKDQRKAAQFKSARKRMARNSPTFGHLIAQLDGHCAAVQIIITPFPLPQFPGHVGFWPRYRYGVCHEGALTEYTDQSIAQIVQDVIGAHFQLGEWDTTTRDWYITLTHSAHNH